MSVYTQKLYDAGVSLWLDNITRDLLTSGTLKKYIQELSVTGLTSNPTIFDHAIGSSGLYDTAIRQNKADGQTEESIFFALALDDLTKAADLFLPVYDRTNGLDGWVSLEVSPLLAYDTQTTLTEAKRLHDLANRPNLFIKIPGTPEGLPAIEEAIFAGVAVNVTLLFSAAQYVAAAEAYLRGVERRIEAGLNPDVRSVASIFISRWDKATTKAAPEGLRNHLGIAVAKQTYAAYRQQLDSERMLRAMNYGAKPQRLLWASTGTKDPRASDILYIHSLAAPYTINTMPEKTLLAFADHGTVGEQLPSDGGDADLTISAFEKKGVNTHELADTLQKEGADSFTASWNHLLETIEIKGR